MASSTQVAQIRRLIYGGSTRTGSLSTGDIGWFADNRGNIWLAAAAAAEAEGAYAGAGRKKVGDLEIDEGNGGWRDLAKSLRLQGLRSVKPYAGGISVSDKETQRSDSDYDQPAVRLGMFDYEGDDSDT